MRRWLGVLAAAAAVLLVVEVVLLGVAIWYLGAAWTLGLTVLKWVAGGLLVRREGVRGWRRFRQALDGGRPPGREVTEAAVAVVAAVLVLLGGFVSAVLGLVTLVPPVRRWVGRLVEGAVAGRLSAAVAGNVFGPRQVRVRREPPGQRGAGTGAEEPGGDATAAAPDADQAAPPVLEGEILPPRDRA